MTNSALRPGRADERHFLFLSALYAVRQTEISQDVRRVFATLIGV